jgi:hypothetical protein
MIRPQLWQIFNPFGRAIVLTLFVIGVWHLFTRLREYFAHYTYQPKVIEGSIRDSETPEQPFTRFSAYTFLLVGYALCIGIGLYIGWHTQDFFSSMNMLIRTPAGAQALANSSAALLIPDLVFYPPIAVLIIDTMQGLAARID